jgi:hypothetical protein
MPTRYQQVLEQKRLSKDHKAKLIREMLYAKKQLGLQEQPKNLGTGTHAPSPKSAPEPATPTVNPRQAEMERRKASQERRGRIQKQLSMRNKKGQPIMKYQVDRLLEKIQRTDAER